MVHRWFSFAAAALAWLAVAAINPLSAQTPPSERELRVYAGLHAAAANGDVAEIERLIANGEKPNLQDSHSRTPLLVAAYRRQTAAAQALLRLGANPNARDTDAYDVLAIAAFNNDLELTKIALAAGADARAVTGADDGSALITAAHLGHVEIVQALIDGKALVDHADARGWTAVTTAVVLGNGDKEHTAVIEALVKAGADVDFKDREGRKALDYARQRGYSEIIHILETATGRHT
jgi:ankyrin repeat protein